MPTADEEDWEAVDGVGEPDEVHLMTDVDLVADLTHPVRGPIMRRLRTPKTVAELAAAMKVPVTRLYHHVNRLEDLGLIRVVATRRVGAVTERRYQVAALSWRFAPSLFERLEPSELAQMMGSLFDVAKIGMQREIEAGMFDSDRVAEERFALSLGELRLKPGTHRNLLDRIKELIEEFESDADENDPDTTVTTLFVAVYPES